MAKKQQTSFLKKILLSLLVITLSGAAAMIYTVYSYVYKTNISFRDKQTKYIYIRTTDNFQDVLKELKEKNILLNLNSFAWLAEYKKYNEQIKPGKYRITQGMSNNQLVNILKAGLQEKVKVNFYNLHTKEQFASRVAKHLEADSTQILEMLNDAGWLDKLGYNEDNALVLIPPGEYEFDSWAVTAKEFMNRMLQEHESFWNEKRRKQLVATKFTKQEVYTLASIIQEEQKQFVEERPRIAGVYINRLREGMKLQADPTVIFAVGDFSINRVLNKHLEIDSPYNTYKVDGLPPGPICIPTANAIDAVLNYEKHSYKFFCAKEDLSGKHNFAKTFEDHTCFAAKYRKALDKRGIYN